ncbi:MAG: murein hydrolase activator EnvC family protein [Actinomycetota bacterium]
MTGRTRQARTALLVGALLITGAYAAPARAQTTAEKLEDAQAQLAQAKAAANAADAAYQEARARLILTEDELAATEAAHDKALQRMGGLQEELGVQARQAYINGPGATETIELLLEADSFSEFTDRMVFLDRMQEADTDVMVRVEVLSEKLRRREVDLVRLEAQQRDTAAQLEQLYAATIAKVNEVDDLADRLGVQLEQEQSFIGTTQVFSGDGLNACPAPGAAFSDTWGAPRSGGRSHQGVDMMGNYGMPIFAAQSGNVTYSYSYLGGNGAYVYGDGGDTMYYAHLQDFVGGARHVAAGEQIATMGDTGNASGTPHLHFEYHPGGGSAVNPTPYVAAVC